MPVQNSDTISWHCTQQFYKSTNIKAAIGILIATCKLWPCTGKAPPVGCRTYFLWRHVLTVLLQCLSQPNLFCTSIHNALNVCPVACTSTTLLVHDSERLRMGHVARSHSDRNVLLHSSTQSQSLLLPSQQLPWDFWRNHEPVLSKCYTTFLRQESKHLLHPESIFMSGRSKFTWLRFPRPQFQLSFEGCQLPFQPNHYLIPAFHEIF